MSIYKKYFDGISPLTSDGEFAKNVAASAKKPNRKIKTLISLPAAAAAVMTLTLTVSAAANFGIGAAVRSFFGDNGNTAEKNIVDVNITNTENTFDSLDISVKGAVRGENLTVIFLDVARTDGGFFDCAPYNVKDGEGRDIIMSDGKIESEVPVYGFTPKIMEVTYADENGEYAGTAETLAYRQYTVKDGSDTDGYLTQAVCIDTSEPFFGMAEGRLVCDKIKLSLGGFSGKKCSGNYSENGNYIMLESYPILDMSGGFSCEIDLGGCGAQSRSVTDAGTASVSAYSHTSDPSEMKFKSFDFNVKSIDVTSVSVSVSLERDAPEKTFYVNTDSFGSVILNDGKEIFFGKYSLPEIVKESGNISSDGEDGKWRFKASFILPEPVETENVRSIKINGTEFIL